MPLVGATIRVVEADPPQGTITDMDGYFLLNNVKTGRVCIEVSFIGYFSQTFNNLSLTSGKELILNVELEEQILEVEEVKITAFKDKTRSKNTVATVSARQFTVEESQRYAGARNDVSRMAANYAGVSTANDAVNDIVIRGNSPNGLLWQLEGVPIPNPNHYGGMGASGGPVSMLNNNVLSNSDFFTSAFPAEYGNASSGVFDLSMRNGNYEKHEFLGMVGFNGFEFGIEGPLSRKNRASYLINYRYSTLGVVAALGGNVGTGTAVPYYQDLSFKLHIPTKNFGKFDIFGLGGINSIDFVNSEKEEDDKESFYEDEFMDLYNKNDLGIIGISNKYLINNTTYTKLTLAASRISNNTEIDSISSTNKSIMDFKRLHYTNYDYTAHFFINKKINKKNSLRIGTKIIHKDFTILDSAYISRLDRFQTGKNEDGSIQLFEAYAQWKHKFSDNISLNTGLHYQKTSLNYNYSIEPRLGFKWKLSKKHSINLGYGLHSQALPLYVYFTRVYTDNDIDFSQPNKDLDFTKSHHFVLGYDWNISSTLRFKAELYYQDIFQSVISDEEEKFSMINANSTTYELPDALKNGGKGRNYGIELTLEKFLDNGFYYLLTTSIFDSKYKNPNTKWISTLFDSKYVVNVLTGKEFQLFPKKEKAKNKKWLSFDGKITAAGGQRYTPVDMENSGIGSVEYDWNRAYSKQFNDYFRADIRVTFRLEGKKVTQEWGVDIQNITDHKNPLRKTFDGKTGEEKNIYQLGIFPMMQYKITF